MRRRHLLRGALALSLPATGCLGTDTGTDAYRVGETATVEGVGEVTVTDIGVQRSVANDYLGLDVYEPATGQVVVVEFDERPNGTEPTPLAPRLDGERVAEPMDIGLYGYQPRGAVAVPVRTVEQAAVVLTRGTEPAWALPEEQVAKLGSAAEFQLRSAAFDHESASLTLTVANDGDRAGTFRGGVDYGDDYTNPFSVPVEAGREVTETVPLSPPWEPERDREFDVTADTRVIGWEYDPADRQ